MPNAINSLDIGVNIISAITVDMSEIVTMRVFAPLVIYIEKASKRTYGIKPQNSMAWFIAKNIEPVPKYGPINETIASPVPFSDSSSGAPFIYLSISMLTLLPKAFPSRTANHDGIISSPFNMRHLLIKPNSYVFYLASTAATAMEGVIHLSFFVSF